MIDRQARAEIDELRQEMLALKFLLENITTIFALEMPGPVANMFLDTLTRRAASAFPGENAAVKKIVAAFVASQRAALFLDETPEVIPVINSGAPAVLDMLPPGLYRIKI